MKVKFTKFHIDFGSRVYQEDEISEVPETQALHYLRQDIAIPVVSADVPVIETADLKSNPKKETR